MTDHAAVAPSSAAMWMSCPASITKAAGRTRPSSKYAREGTAAHKVAEMIIRGNVFPPGKITVEGEQFIVGLPMLRALNPYIDFVQGLQQGTRAIRIEAKVKLTGTVVWGTADCAARRGDFLHVVDLKYGMGVPVDPNSAQLKIYALAARDTLWPGETINYASLTVVQPRLDPLPKTYTLDMRELLEWRYHELRPALKRITANDQTEKVGPYCRWCVRKQECDSFRRYKGSLAADIFDDGVDVLKT